MMRNILVIVSVISLVPYWRGAAHPLCYYDEKSPDPEASMAFCPQEPEGACCNEEEETAAIIVYKAASEEELTGDCADYYRQVACGPCNSFSAHLYERLSGRGPEDGMTMKQSFCDELVAACEGQITFPTYDDETYCEKHVGGTADLLWSYPIDEDAKTFVSSGLVAAFPDLSDSDIPENIICMHMTPGGDEWWMGSQDGQMVKVSDKGVFMGSRRRAKAGEGWRRWVQARMVLEESFLMHHYSPNIDSIVRSVGPSSPFMYSNIAAIGWNGIDPR